MLSGQSPPRSLIGPRYSYDQYLADLSIKESALGQKRTFTQPDRNAVPMQTGAARKRRNPRGLIVYILNRFDPPRLVRW